jgi:hypothetical protein
MVQKKKKAGGCRAERERNAYTEREGHTNAATYQDAARAGKKEPPAPEERVRSPGKRGGRQGGERAQSTRGPKPAPWWCDQSFAFPCCLHASPLSHAHTGVLRSRSPGIMRAGRLISAEKTRQWRSREMCAQGARSAMREGSSSGTMQGSALLAHPNHSPRAAWIVAFVL